jgi:hypothetical protein
MFIGFNLRMQIGCWKWLILKSVSRSLLLPKLPSGWGSTCHRLVLTEPHSRVFSAHLSCRSVVIGRGTTGDTEANI